MFCCSRAQKKTETEPKPIINLEFNRLKRIVLLPTYYYVHHTTPSPTIIPPLRRPLFMISVEIDYSWELFFRELNSDSRLDFLPFFDSFFTFSSLSGFSVTSCFLSDFLESSFLDLWWWWWDLDGFWSVNNFTLWTYQHTVWKFHHFSVTQILRELNFDESRSPKIAIFCLFGLWILIFWWISAFKECKN